jgi:Asp-tRNA(Asn)/Glu-tRNA(Gln) amidotransferase A subunit family amidase
VSSIFLEQSVPQLLKNIELDILSFNDLVEEVAQQIYLHEAKTLAWVTCDMERLRKDSENAYRIYKTRGRLLGLDGIPFGVKDIINTKSYPTQMGSPLWKGFTPGNNARVVDSLLGEGGLVVGKTVTAEFAVHALNETMNPHDPLKTPGTSSSGSAAAVATGMVPFALATQTAGSIVRPASFCGVWGMKPSFGMIPRTGILKTTDSLDTVGFLASHAESLRPILDVLRVKGPDYPYIYRNVDWRGARPKANGRPWRVGFIKSHTWSEAAPYAKRAVERLALDIRQIPNFEVEEIAWPAELCEAHDIHAVIYKKSLSYYFQHEMKIDMHVTEIMRCMIDEGVNISSAEYRSALIKQERLCELLLNLFASYDMVLSLGTSSSAPIRGEAELRDPSLIWTLGHLPVIAAPTFRCPEGLPYGVQFTSGKWNDYLLLQCIEELIQIGFLPAGSMKISPN